MLRQSRQTSRDLAVSRPARSASFFTTRATSIGARRPGCTRPCLLIEQNNGPSMSPACSSHPYSARNGRSVFKSCWPSGPTVEVRTRTSKTGRRGVYQSNKELAATAWRQERTPIHRPASANPTASSSNPSWPNAETPWPTGRTGGQRLPLQIRRRETPRSLRRASGPSRPKRPAEPRRSADAARCRLVPEMDSEFAARDRRER